MSEQGQLPKSAAAQEGFFGFQVRPNETTQWDTVSSDSNRDDAGRYKKVRRLKPCSSLSALWFAPWYTLFLQLRIPHPL